MHEFLSVSWGGKIKYTTKTFNIERTYKPYTKQIDVSLKGYTPIAAGIKSFYQDNTDKGEVMSCSCSLSGNTVTISCGGSWGASAPFYTVSFYVAYVPG